MKDSRKMMIERRVARIRGKIEVDTQIRANTLSSLQEIFDTAVSLAKGELNTQNADRARSSLRRR